MPGTAKDTPPALINDRPLVAPLADRDVEKISHLWQAAVLAQGLSVPRQLLQVMGR